MGRLAKVFKRLEGNSYKFYVPEILGALKERIDDINEQDENGNTILHCIFDSLRYLTETQLTELRPILDILFLKGANITIKNNEGQFAFDLIKFNIYLLPQFFYDFIALIQTRQPEALPSLFAKVLDDTFIHDSNSVLYANGFLKSIYEKLNVEKLNNINLQAIFGLFKSLYDKVCERVKQEHLKRKTESCVKTYNYDTYKNEQQTLETVCKQLREEMIVRKITPNHLFLLNPFLDEADKLKSTIIRAILQDYTPTEKKTSIRSLFIEIINENFSQSILLQSELEQFIKIVEKARLAEKLSEDLQLTPVPLSKEDRDSLDSFFSQAEEKCFFFSSAKELWIAHQKESSITAAAPSTLFTPVASPRLSPHLPEKNDKEQMRATRS